MTDTNYHEAWTPKPHHHTVHNDQHSSYMCEHCSRLTPPSPPVKVSTQTADTYLRHAQWDHYHLLFGLLLLVIRAMHCAQDLSSSHTSCCPLLPGITPCRGCLQDSWDRFVEANWAPTLRSAFGQNWKQTVGSEVPAMMQLSQHPSRQLTDMKPSPSSSWSRRDPNASASHSAGRLPQNSPAFSSALNPQYASTSQNSAPMSSQVHQQTAGNSRSGAMDEWADIFDQCKTAIDRSDPSPGAQGQQEDPKAFAGFMPGPGGTYTGPANGAFESAKSLNSEEAEDCMFGESDDEECHSSSNGGPQRLPFFGGIAEWPVKQMQHLPVRFCHFLCLGRLCCLHLSVC